MLTSKVGEFSVFYDNSEEFHHIKQEIFTHNSYYFETDHDTPVIIDAGAHIGLATLYFKRLYPHTQVIAIEPNPHTFQLLKRNIEENQLHDVALHQVALAPHAGQQPFYLDSTPLHWWSTAGFIQGAWNHQQQSQEMKVSTQPLTHFLTQPITLLKLDIEGAEQAVLQASADRLHLIQHMIIEFHPHAQQSLPRLTDFLTRHRFSVTLWQNGQETTPEKAKGLVLVEAAQNTK